MKTVLFACVHNAGRSQMAAAWFNRLVDSSKARAISAGTDPGPQVHPEADQTQFVCANEQYYLLRDNDPVTWPTANGKEFLDELATFWRDWN